MAEYIEREKAIDALTERNLVVHMDSVNDGLVASCHRSAQRIIANLPAADVRPVVRGKWIESKSIMEVLYCSECGFRTIYGAMPDGLGRNYSYCPNCGADMREES